MFWFRLGCPLDEVISSSRGLYKSLLALSTLYKCSTQLKTTAGEFGEYKKCKNRGEEGKNLWSTDCPEKLEAKRCGKKVWKATNASTRKEVFVDVTPMSVILRSCRSADACVLIKLRSKHNKRQCMSFSIVDWMVFPPYTLLAAHHSLRLSWHVWKCRAATAAANKNYSSHSCEVASTSWKKPAATVFWGFCFFAVNWNIRVRGKAIKRQTRSASNLLGTFLIRTTWTSNSPPDSYRVRHLRYPRFTSVSCKLCEVWLMPWTSSAICSSHSSLFYCSFI